MDKRYITKYVTTENARHVTAFVPETKIRYRVIIKSIIFEKKTIKIAYTVIFIPVLRYSH